MECRTAQRRSLTRFGRWSSGARRRSGSRPRTGSRSRRARGGPRRGRSRPAGRRARPPSTSPGHSTRCATTRPSSMRGRFTQTRSSGAAGWLRTPPRCSRPGTRALTHCNAGGLATGGYGSAVGALLAAWERGLLAHVWVDETRPLLQGARLTAWELETAGDPARGHRRLGRRVADGRGRGRLRRSPAPTGSPRTATPRTRSAPTRSPCSRTTTGSRSTSSRRARPSISRRPTGAAIPIEERDPAEVTTRFAARNPAFDVTPAALIAAIVTEAGVHRAPFARFARGGRGRRMKASSSPPATRRGFGPLTDTMAKELLPVGGRPIVDWIVDEHRARSPRSTRCTSSRTRARRRRSAEWAEGREVIVHDDGTTSNEDRLGAIGDMQLRDRARRDRRRPARDRRRQPLRLQPRRLRRVLARQGAAASAVAVRDSARSSSPRQYGIVELDADDRIVDFIEKPDDPPSTLAATATYFYPREHVPARRRRISTTGNPPDQPGRFVAWLQRREPVYGWRFDGDWFDIGDHEQLLEADNRLRAARRPAGAALPTRPTSARTQNRTKLSQTRCGLPT